jgi:hypothetical protein
MLNPLPARTRVNNTHPSLFVPLHPFANLQLTHAANGRLKCHSSARHQVSYPLITDRCCLAHSISKAPTFNMLQHY